jgi:hypothetical protein
MKRCRFNNDTFWILACFLHSERFCFSAASFSRMTCRLALSATVRSGLIPVIGASVLGGDVWAQIGSGIVDAAIAFIAIKIAKRIIGNSHLVL